MDDFLILFLTLILIIFIFIFIFISKPENVKDKSKQPLGMGPVFKEHRTGCVLCVLSGNIKLEPVLLYLKTHTDG